MIEQFKKDVDNGLSAEKKHLPSKYFYDKKGDAFFVKIMNTPEYYLTRAEMDIFKNQTHDIIKALDLKPNTYFELIELGAGDGTKTKELLKVLSEEAYQFDYFPIDISQNALDQLEVSLNKELPNVSVKKQQGDYFDVLASLKNSTIPKVILFLGSNIGNMNDKQAGEFIYKLGANLTRGDYLFLGLDLKKSSSIILPAYNDKQGITRDFNLNLLERINRELGGNFDIAQFKHIPEYNEKEGVAKSYIQSKIDQKVMISSIKKTYFFKKGEYIHTEISRKYDDTIVEGLIKNTDFRITQKLMDTQKLFADYILKRF
ncbi:L-histidine N(alpha)-methyltransferase [Flavobacteriaceae bacterium UJ101]|nr:L-histidine N(alpha)-methyltransferase [Flavobacteriaceae bacterium UJ101]